MRRAAAALMLLAAACSSGTKESAAERGETLRPTFEPESSTSTSTTLTIGSTASASRTVSTETPTSAAIAPPLEASATDRQGDLTPSIEPPPTWADLLGAQLSRSASGFELRVHLGGNAAPEHTPDSDHTMNIASFYDVDGDGNIDYEVWANVGSGGWGSSYFDDTRNRAWYQERSEVVVRPEGEDVVLTFPLAHVANASRFRWSVSSEWGRYETIGTIAAARDYVPADGAIDFPS